MKRKTIAPSNTPVAQPSAGFFETIARTIEQARRFVGRTADLTMCATYFEIGRMIVEEEQGGKARAEYGGRLIHELSAYLGERFGSGFSVVNLKSFRKFYQIYAPQIGQSMTAQFKDDLENQKGQTLSAQSATRPKRWALSALSSSFSLGWSHYQVLMRIKNDMERRFYEIETTNEQWTVAQLQRQYNSSLYERLALSRDKEMAIENPFGISHRSPGLRVSAQPWGGAKTNVQPRRGCTLFFRQHNLGSRALVAFSNSPMCNPSGVGHLFSRRPRVASRCSATLGFDVQPLRGCQIPKPLSPWQGGCLATSQFQPPI